MRMRIPLPIGVKLGVMVIVTVLISVSISVYYVSQKFNETAMSIINEEFEQTMTLVENYFDLLEQSNYFFANALAQDEKIVTAFKQKDTKRVTELLEEQRSAMQLDELVILNRNGNIIAQTGLLNFSGINIRHYHHIKESLSKGEFFSGIIRQDDVFVYYTTAVIKEEAELIGLVMVGLAITNRVMQGIKNNTSMEFSIVGDRAMAATSMREQEDSLKTLPVDYLKYLWLLEDNDRMISGSYNEKNYFFKARNLKKIDESTSASLMLAYDKINYDKSVEELQVLQYKIIFVLFVILLIIIFLLGFYLHRNFFKLILAIVRVRHGNYSEKVEIKTGDELEKLGHHFNEMSLSILRQEDELKSYANNLEEKIEERTHEIRLRNSYLQTILDQQNAMILTIEKHHITFVNRYFLDFFDAASLEEYHELYDWKLIFGCDIDASDDKSLTYCIDNLIKRSKQDQQIALTSLEGTRKFFQVEVAQIQEASFLVTLQDITAFKDEEQRLYTQATRDVLTGLYNRQKFEDLFEKMCFQAERIDEDVALVIADIDYFKRINDTYGHLIGDSALLSMALIFNERIRKSDIVARWGGEEFVLALHVKSEQEAFDVVEVIRNRIEVHNFDHFKHLTCSFGVSLVRKHEPIDRVFERTDKALYQAKSEGRNRAVML